MKTTGISCVTKFRLLFFLGHPTVYEVDSIPGCSPYNRLVRSGPPPKLISQLSGEGDGGEGEEGDEEGGEVRGEEEGPRCCQVYQASNKPLKHLLFRGSEKPELFW